MNQYGVELRWALPCGHERVAIVDVPQQHKAMAQEKLEQCRALDLAAHESGERKCDYCEAAKK